MNRFIELELTDGRKVSFNIDQIVSVVPKQYNSTETVINTTEVMAPDELWVVAASYSTVMGLIDYASHGGNS